MRRRQGWTDFCGGTHLETESLRIALPLSGQRPPQISTLLFSLLQVPLILAPFPLAVLPAWPWPRDRVVSWGGDTRSWAAAKLIKCLRFFHRTLTPPYQWMNHCSLTPPSRKFTTAWMTSLEAGTVFWRDWGPRDWPWRWGPIWGDREKALCFDFSQQCETRL